MVKNYTYKAKDRKGNLITGTLLADSENAVALHIRKKDCFVLQIKEKNTGNNLYAVVRRQLSTVKIKDLALICRQLATMIEAGLPLLTCIGIVIDQSENACSKTALQSVYKNVKEGETFSRALAQHRHVFPAIMINMVEAGEIGGALATVLERLAVHFEKEHKLSERIKSAMTYPAVVITMAILAVIFIFTFVLPVFITVFVDMKVELPWPTRILLLVSDFLQDDWLFLLIGSIGIGLLGKLALTRPDIGRIRDKMVLALPIVGKLVQKVAIARFSRTLSTLIRGGVPIIAALEVVKKVIDNLRMIEAVTVAQANLKAGITLAETLAASRVFTPMVIQMVAIGEESGAIDKMLEKVADYYESEVDDMVARMSSIIEPVIVGILGVFIGFIVIAIILPMFDIIASVGSSM